MHVYNVLKLFEEEEEAYYDGRYDDELEEMGRTSHLSFDQSLEKLRYRMEQEFNERKLEMFEVKRDISQLK